MKKTVLLSIILFLLLSAPGVSIAQPFGNYGLGAPLEGVSIVPVKGGFYSHIGPHGHLYGFKSFQHPGYRCHGLHGYEHYRYKELHRLDRFRDIRYPRYRPYYYSPFDRSFGFGFLNPYLN